MNADRELEERIAEIERDFEALLHQVTPGYGPSPNFIAPALIGQARVVRTVTTYGAYEKPI